VIVASIALHCQFKSARTDLLHLNYVTTNVNVMLKIVLPWQKPNIDYGYKTVMLLFLEKMVRQWALAAGNSAIAEKAPYIRVRVRSGDWVQVCV